MIVIGLILFFLGLIYLLGNLGVITLSTSFWNILWPTVLIIVGAYLVSAAFRIRQYKDWFRRFYKD